MTPEASGPSPLHAALRQATRLPHHALDHHLLLAPLVRPGADVVQYGNALAALHGIYAQAESAVFRFLAAHPGLFDYRSREKLPALDADLAALGRQPLPARAGGPELQSIGALIGVLYTVEGSTLGGQYIARNLRQHPGAGLPMQFFSGYGENARQRWSEFLQFADANCPPNEIEAATSTAVLLFESIRVHLDCCQETLCVAPG